MQPVPCWEKVWGPPDNAPPGTTLRVYKWVKTDKKQVCPGADLRHVLSLRLIYSNSVTTRASSPTSHSRRCRSQKRSRWATGTRR